MTDEETETIEIHGREGLVTEFNDGKRNGLDVGSVSTGGMAPGLNYVLTKHAVCVVDKQTGHEIGRAEIDFEYQWYDHNDNPVDEDDPTTKRGEPTEPKEGAVQEAINRAQDIGDGFLTGWRRRHKHGVHADIEDYAEKIGKIECAEVQSTSPEKDEISVTVSVSNPDWGLPDEVHNWIQDHPAIEIIDISNISSDSITVHLDKDDARRSRY